VPDAAETPSQKSLAEAVQESVPLPTFAIEIVWAAGAAPPAAYAKASV
jgi:hypothetical protein